MTKRERELLIAQNKFLGKCPVCGQRLKKMDGVNILRCENNFCSGVELHRNGEVHREPYYKIMSDRRIKAYNRLFKTN